MNASLSCGGVFDLEKKQERLEKLRAQASQEAFWTNPDEAKKVLQEQSNLEAEFNSWDVQNRAVGDLKALADLTDEVEGKDKQDALADLAQEFKKIETGVERLEFRFMLSGEMDPNSAILSINAGAGGTESCDWAEMLLRMYCRWAEKKGFVAEIIDQQAGDGAGIRSATLTLEGPFAFGYAKAESGVHRLVRISPFDANKRRHTSFASVYVTPQIDDSIEVNIRDEDLRLETMRAGGAGGQHVNTTESAVRITHIPTGIVVQCQNERSQHQNKATALKVLRAKLYEREMQEREARLQAIRSSKKENAWGSQIRSYVLHPYQLIKDHRTNFERGDVGVVLDGDLDPFIENFLLSEKNRATEGEAL